MTIISKENIPLSSTAMNPNAEHSSSSSTDPLLDSTTTSPKMVKHNAAVRDVTTMEYTPTETSNFQETTKIVEKSVSKKRLITETLETVDGNVVDNRNVGDDTENNDADVNESQTAPSSLLETNDDSTKIYIDQDHHQQQQLQMKSDDGVDAEQVTATTSAGTAATTMTQSEESTTTIDLQRPVKRARTAYFLFLDDFRSTIQKEVNVYFITISPLIHDHFLCSLIGAIILSCFLVNIQNPGAGVATVARILGQRWSAMSEDDKQPYHARALEERERVTAATEAWKKAAVAAGKDISSTAKSNTDRTLDACSHTNANGVASIVLPVGRVRKICRLDPDVRGISKEALLLITKITESVTIQLGQECIKTAHIQNRRTLLPQDIVDVCNIRESFFFLKDDITDLHQQQQKLRKAKQQQNGNAASQRKGNIHGASSSTTMTASTSKSMTDYFKPVA